MGRIHQGIALYHQGLAPELWHTGDTIKPGSRMKDPESMHFARFAARLAVERGVPAQSIHLLATTSTWEDGQQVIALARAREIKSILVVTDWYHSRRALRVLARQASTGRRAGSQPGTLEGSDAEPAIYYAPSADQDALGIAYGPENWWRHRAGWAAVLGELLKMCYYTLRYGVAPRYWGG